MHVGNVFVFLVNFSISMTHEKFRVRSLIGDPHTPIKAVIW